MKINEEGKPVNFLQTPLDYAMFVIAKDCFESQINTKIGYEAGLANLTFETSLVYGCALDIRINGFSQKIFQFAYLFIENLIEFTESKLENSQLLIKDFEVI